MGRDQRDSRDTPPQGQPPAISLLAASAPQFFLSTSSFLDIALPLSARASHILAGPSGSFLFLPPARIAPPRRPRSGQGSPPTSSRCSGYHHHHLDLTTTPSTPITLAAMAEANRDPVSSTRLYLGNLPPNGMPSRKISTRYTSGCTSLVLCRPAIRVSAVALFRISPSCSTTDIHTHADKILGLALRRALL